MKKITALLLLSVMLLSACAAQKAEITTAQTTEAEDVTANSSEPAATTEAEQTTEAEAVTLPTGLGTPDGMENIDLSDASTILPLLPSVQLEWQSERDEWPSLAMIDAENRIAYFRSGYLEHYLFYYDENGEYTLFYAYWPQVMPEEWTLVADSAGALTALFTVTEVLRFLYPSELFSLRNEASFMIAPDEAVGTFGLCDVYRVIGGAEDASTILLDKKTGLLVQYRSGSKVKLELLNIEFTVPTFTALPVAETNEEP